MKSRILFVEDEKTVRDHIAWALSDEYEVETAGNGKEALQAVLRSQPDIVVSDVMMPGLNGIELLKTLRSTPGTQTIPMLLISGEAPELWQIEGFEEGADGYLNKPYTERELRVRIRALLQVSQARIEGARREARELAEKQALADRAAILESITDAFYALDRQWRFTYINQRALAYFNRSRESLIGRNIWELFPGTQGTIFQSEYERVLREQTTAVFEVLSPFSGLWVDVHAYPTPQGLAVNFRDITERKQIQQQLKEAGRRKDEFLSVLAHELRNPLAPIRNGLQILKLRHSADDSINNTIGMMDRQMTHLVRLVDDLLDVGRITRGKLELRIQRVVLTDILSSAIETVRPLIEAQDHTVEVRTSPEVLAVDGDPDRLTQVFANLLSNSAKYMERGGRIELNVRSEGGNAFVDVKDSGMGIAPHTLEHIFELFSQGQPSQGQENGGLGIGLWLVQMLIQLHEGSVTATSEGSGQGSTFTVRLPLSEELSPVPQVSDESSTAPATSVRDVLVVDDNQDAAQSLAMLLSLEGHRTRTVFGGAAAIGECVQRLPDVIFMDIGMVPLNGYETTRRIRALPGADRIFIVALTGWGQAVDRQRTREAGMNRHLVKPVDIETLKEVVSGQL